MRLYSVHNWLYVYPAKCHKNWTKLKTGYWFQYPLAHSVTHITRWRWRALSVCPRGFLVKLSKNSEWDFCKIFKCLNNLWFNVDILVCQTTKHWKKYTRKKSPKFKKTNKTVHTSFSILVCPYIHPSFQTSIRLCTYVCTPWETCIHMSCICLLISLKYRKCRQPFLIFYAAVIRF